MIDNWNKVAHEAGAGYKNLHFIDMANVFCKDATCSMLDQKGNMLYMDTNHLNIRGSLYAAPFIFSQLRK